MRRRAIHSQISMVRTLRFPAITWLAFVAGLFFGGTQQEGLRFGHMEPRPKLNRLAQRILSERLRALWEQLKARFASQAEEDLARAEERHRGRNEL